MRPDSYERKLPADPALKKSRASQSARLERTAVRIYCAMITKHGLDSDEKQAVLHARALLKEIDRAEL